MTPPTATATDRDTDPGVVLDEEAQVTATELTDREKYVALVLRLSEQSVAKHFDAYGDIPWDDPDFVIDHDDPRWELPEWETLAQTEWYRSLDQRTKNQVGLYRYASAAKLGMEFENVLKRGLLSFAFFRLGNGDPEFRYVYHEVAEETHHGMMFQEFVNRCGFDVPGLRRDERIGSQFVVAFGRFFPELFFIFVLGGEDPIDHLQRRMLRSGRDLPPVFERIMRHHVTEEARHLSFARSHLKQRVPQLSAARRAVLSVAGPLILGEMAKQMLTPPRSMAREFDIPAEVLREAYGRDNAQHREGAIESVRKVRRLMRELGLMNPVATRVWKAVGLWAED